MKYSKRVKYILITLLFLVELSCVFLTVKSYTNKDIDKIKEVNKIDKEMFTMYIEQDDGTYKEETGTDYFPRIGYRINEEKTVCKDHYGKEIEQAITFKDGSITVTGNKTVFCTLYFKKKGDDITVTVSTSGTTGVVPTAAGYKASLTCDTADSLFNEKYQRVEISAATTDEVKCNLDYTKTSTSSYTTLKSEVESKAITITSTNYSGGTDTSYRYTGKTPSNWVWFNNEMWRIIGSIPTCTSSGCGASTNLVKIIRNDSIGGIVYDAKTNDNATMEWGSNTLYSLLNTSYYATQEKYMNATYSEWCYSDYLSSIYGTCDYRNIGILKNSYYGRMITNVYWNTGASSYNVTAAEAYTNETATQTVSGYVGIMNLSDYGYATSSSYYSTVLGNYNSTEITGASWIFKGDAEYTSIKGNATRANVILPSGELDKGYFPVSTAGNYSVRPVVYLNSSVYIIDGTGTQADPYIIGM